MKEFRIFNFEFILIVFDYPILDMLMAQFYLNVFILQYGQN
jgi:hypothetical protein